MRFGRVLLFGVLCLAVSGPAAAVTYQVNAAAVCPGSGTTLAPYCTIGNAAAVAVAGDVIQVAAGIYREQVTPPSSGSAGLPITYRGAAGARVYGTNNVSGAGLWTLFAGTTYSTPFNPTTNTAQVFVDGVRLASAASATTVPTGGFFFDTAADVLYVNLGGDNPGNHDVEAGARSFGFSIDTKSDLVIEGFEVRGHNTNGIRARTVSNVVIRNNRVLRAASFGLVVDSTSPAVSGPVELSGNEVLENASAGIRLRESVTNVTVRGNSSHNNFSHGLLATGTTNSLFENNRFFDNRTPGVDAFTTGLRLDGSTGNTIQRNLAFGNQDTGFQVSAGSSNNLLIRNISYANEDHGYDVRQCDMPRLVSNTAWANVNDGFSIEDNVTNAYVRNNVGSDNGLLTNGNDLWVAADSTVGFSSDYDVFYRSSLSGNTIEYGGGVYPSVAAFQATGHEAHGVGANPNFVNPNAGDFHPGLGPTIDAADASASGFAALDYAGQAPIDLSGVPNSGAGVPNFADRGALERRDAPPVARLTVTPKKVVVGQQLTASGATSTDDVGVVTYRFVWGDGTPDTVQSGPVAMHTYTRKGKFKLQLTVTDGAGQSSTVQKGLNVK